MHSRTSLRHGGLVVGLAALCACATQPMAHVAPPAPQVGHVILQAQAEDPSQPGVVLPAYETAAERAALGKADLASDTRNSFKQWYAQTVPPEQGRFRALQEWEPMRDVWTTYSPGITSVLPVRRMMAQMVLHFVRDSNPKGKAHVIVGGATAAANFLTALDELGITAEEKALVEMVTLPNQTIWHIDYGALPLVDKQNKTVSFTDFMYYPQRQTDDAIPTRLASEYYKDISVYRMPMSYEGGNFQADGMGNCMTSLRELKNTGFSEAKTRKLLKEYAGCDKLIIVKDVTDDGTGHIDMFFKWIDVDHVMIAKYDDDITLDYDGDGKLETLPMPGATDDYKATFKLNQQRMEDNVALFAGQTAPNGKPYQVSRLSMMTRYKDSYGDLPRTFINSTFFNGVNVYPSYATKSCRDPAGAKCMTDSECGNGGHCAAGKCTLNALGSTVCAADADCPADSTCVNAACLNAKQAQVKQICKTNSQCLGGAVCLAGECRDIAPVTDGCDELMPCAKGLECVDDPLKIALTAQVQKQWEAAMPTWKHVGLGADTIALWSGAVHCITRTIPDFPGQKSVADGLCLEGACHCAPGGTTQSCTDDSECWGPKWVCGCNQCAGVCPTGLCKKSSGKPLSVCNVDVDCASDTTPTTAGACSTACRDDIDCAADGTTVVPGACKIDAAQGCYGNAPDGKQPAGSAPTTCPNGPDAGSGQDTSAASDVPSAVDASGGGDLANKADATVIPPMSKISIGHDTGCTTASGGRSGGLGVLGLLCAGWLLLRRRRKA